MTALGITIWLITGFAAMLLAIRLWPDWWLIHPDILEWNRGYPFDRFGREYPKDDGRRVFRGCDGHGDLCSFPQVLLVLMPIAGPASWVMMALVLITKGNIQSIAKKTASRKEIEAELARARAELDEFMKGSK